MEWLNWFSNTLSDSSQRLHVAMANMDAAMKEADRAINDLRFRGV